MITLDLVLESFRTVRTNTIHIARDIPADQYGFRAAEVFPTVLELFRNIVSITEFMSTVALNADPISITPETRAAVRAAHTWTHPDTLIDPDTVAAALTASMQEITRRAQAAGSAHYATSVVAPDGIEKNRLWILNTAKEQEMVIRGQLLLIERMLGIVPHTTRLAQAREAERRAAGENGGR
jgi:hypothetical protein